MVIVGGGWGCLEPIAYSLGFRAARRTVQQTTSDGLKQWGSGVGVGVGVGVGIASSSTGSHGGVITDVQQILAAIPRELVVVQSMQLAWFMGAELWRRQTGVGSNLHICTCTPASRHQMGLCEDHAARWFASCRKVSLSAPAWVASATPASIVNPRSDVSFGRRGLMWVGRLSEFWIPSQGRL